MERHSSTSRREDWVIRHLDVSDHTPFIVEVSHCDYYDNSPLAFFSSRYHLGLGTPFDRRPICRI
jgi:hypothetical protein